MAFYKIFQSGNNIEVYEYQKMMVPENEFKENGYESKIEKLEIEEDRKEKFQLSKEDLKRKRRLQTMRENRGHLMRIARKYFDSDFLFLTLTFAGDYYTKEKVSEADAKVDYMFKKLRRKLGAVSYVGVRELQKRGVIHYHYLIKNDELLKAYEDIPVPIKKGKKRISSDKQKYYEQYFQNIYWPHGYVTLYKIDDCDNVGAYLAKYMTKGDVKEMEWLEGRRMYLKSGDIKIIKALDANEDSEIIKSIVDLLPYYQSIAEEDIFFNSERKRVFMNGYKSEFNGQVKYYDINISRMNE